MRITHIRIRAINVPLIKPYRLSGMGTVSTTESVIVEVFTDAGLVGIGETDPALMFTGESQQTVLAALRYHLGPALLGRDPTALEALHATMDGLCLRNGFAKAALDLACHDLLGKALNAPLYALLGGLVRDRIPIMWSLGSDTVEANVADAVRRAEEGYRTIGLKVGVLPPDQDAARVRAVRRAVGDGVAIRCDANQAWTPRAAVTAIRRLEEWGIAMIEQPVPADDIEGLAEVRAAVQVPVAADESVASPAEALRLIRAKAADIFSIKTTKLGGLLPSKKTAAVVEAAGGALFINSMIELGVSVAASLHFAVTCRDLCSVGHALTSVRRLQDDILQDPIRYAGAEILAPDATPGLGVALDEAKMRRYAVAEVRLP